MRCAVRLSKETGRHPDCNSKGTPKLEQLKMSMVEHLGDARAGTTQYEHGARNIKLVHQLGTRAFQRSSAKRFSEEQNKRRSSATERLDELEVTPFDGDEEESVCRGYSIGLHRAKLAWKNTSWISTSHQLSIDPEEL
ncbi:hypothetical protein F511_28417 [Dorcoceras hygrometricum]|uniref:Uncharacterized protein n=1 Tax=Dorcoceras hygrometricum TaxID=472368 RepID=A0A2Z7AXH2_9LAMI|nr:hypothetical protein F511_28417 [Dorcoceras hygrometricum]